MPRKKKEAITNTKRCEACREDFPLGAVSPFYLGRKDGKSVHVWLCESDKLEWHVDWRKRGMPL